MVKVALFDAFPDADQESGAGRGAGRKAHLAGRVADALMAQATDLLASPPAIEMVDLLAAKLPAS